MLYALMSLGAERTYRDGLRAQSAIDATLLLRTASATFPFDHRFRTASALHLGRIALQTKSLDWLGAALPEIKFAIERDPASAELWALLINIEIALGHDTAARLHHRQFKRVAGASPFHPFGE